MKRRCRVCLLSLLLVVVFDCNLKAQLTVQRVIDGDTFELSNGETVRLIGIDSPEKYMSDHLREDARRKDMDIETIKELGREASKYAQQLVEGKQVELTFDQANTDSDHRGGYGRLLAYVWILDESGKRQFMVNRRMVEDGYAYAYTKYPFKFMEEFRKLEREARKQKLGLWNKKIHSGNGND